MAFDTLAPHALRKEYPITSTLATVLSCASHAPSPGQSNTFGSAYFDWPVDGPATTFRLPELDVVWGMVTGVRYPELPVVDVLAGADWTEVIFPEDVAEELEDR